MLLYLRTGNALAVYIQSIEPVAVYQMARSVLLLDKIGPSKQRGLSLKGCHAAIYALATLWLVIVARRSSRGSANAGNNDNGHVCFAALSNADADSVHGFNGLVELAAELASQGERVVFLDIDSSWQQPFGSITRPTYNASAVRTFLQQVRPIMPWFHGMPVTRPAMALLEHLRLRPGLCSQLHTIDRNGYGSYVAQAKRAGLREFAYMQVITHAGGAEVVSPHKMTWSEHKTRQLNDLFRSAHERIVIENSDVVIFPTEIHRERLAARWKLPTTTYVAKTWSSWKTPAGQADSNTRLPFAAQPDMIVLAAENLDERAGPALLYQACALLPASVRRDKYVLLVGDVAPDFKVGLASMRTAFQNLGLTLMSHGWKDAMDIGIWGELRTRTVFVFPSWLDQENPALLKAIDSGAGILVSNIAYHREIVPKGELAGCVFELHANSLARKLYGVLSGRQAMQRVSSANYPKLTTAQVVRSLLRRSATHDLPSKLEPVTVIIPFCDRTEYFDTAITSVSDQQAGGPKRHVLLVAACPAQQRCPNLDALNTARDYALSSLRCIESSGAEGSLGGARNFGVSQSTTDLNFFLDDDDELDERALYDLAVAASLNPYIGHFSSFADIFYDDGTNAGKINQTDARWSLIGPTPEIATIVNAVGFANMLVRKSSPVFKRRNGFSEDLALGSGCEDWEIAAVAAFSGDTILVPARTYWYRKRIDRAGQIRGMLAQIGQDEIQPALCRARVINAVATVKNIAWLQPLSQYAQAMYERHDTIKW